MLSQVCQNPRLFKILAKVCYVVLLLLGIGIVIVTVQTADIDTGPGGGELTVSGSGTTLEKSQLITFCLSLVSAFVAAVQAFSPSPAVARPSRSPEHRVKAVKGNPFTELKKTKVCIVPPPTRAFEHLFIKPSAPGPSRSSRFVRIIIIITISDQTLPQQ